MLNIWQKALHYAGRISCFQIHQGGAEASATVMSIIETAKLKKIDSFKYLTYIFKTAPQLDMTKEEDVEKLLPEVFLNGQKENA